MLLLRMMALLGLILTMACGPSPESGDSNPVGNNRSAAKAPNGIGNDGVPYPALADFKPQDQARLEKAREHLDRQIANNAANLATHYGEMGMLYHAFDLHRAALACYKRAVELEPTTHRWTYYLAASNRALGQVQPAMSHYRRSLELKGDHVPSMVHLGYLLVESDRPQDSGPLFAKALTLRPRSAAAWMGKGRFHHAVGEYGAALDALQEALKLAPSANAIHGYLAQAYRAAGMREQAEMHFEQRGERLPGLIDPLLVAVQDVAQPDRQLREKSRRAVAEGDLEQAHAYLAEAVAMNETDPLLNFNLGEVTRSLGRAQQAEEIFERVLRYGPTQSLRVKTLVHLATLKGAKGELEPAFHHLSTANELDANNQTVNFYLADVARLTGHFDEAFDAYQFLVEQAPNNFPVRLGRVLCLIRLQRYDRAIEALRDDVRASNGVFTFQHLLARVLATVPSSQGGNPREALQIIRNLTRDGVDSSTAATMAMALAANGSFPEAVTWQRKAIELSKVDAFTLTEDLEAKLAKYKRNEPVDQPFPDNHPLYLQPNYRNLK